MHIVTNLSAFEFQQKALHFPLNMPLWCKMKFRFIASHHKHWSNKYKTSQIWSTIVRQKKTWVKERELVIDSINILYNIYNQWKHYTTPVTKGAL